MSYGVPCKFLLIPQILHLNNLTNANPVDFPANAALDITDGFGGNSWPFAHFNIITTRTSSLQDCLKAKGMPSNDNSTNKFMLYFLAMHDFLQWVVTSPVAVQLWQQQGNGFLPSGMVSSLLQIVGKMTCCQRVDGGSQKSCMYKTIYAQFGH